ncbi:MAG: PAC2 family protein [Acidimicrobiales bacterium]
MTELTWNERPTLRRPLLLIAFEGLFDAAEAATDALGWIRERNDSVQVAEIDGETFYNFVEIRPTVRIAGSGGRVIDWPGARVWAVRTDSVRDLLVMTGTEPQLRWGTFADLILDVARQSGAEMAVTVGAMVSMVPHTRPFTITGSAANPELARRLNLDRPTYEGPTGIAGVINERLDRSGLPVMSLRVAVPHYVPSPPNPKATRALLRSIQKTTGVPTGYEELDGAVNEWVKRVDQAVGSDEETTNYVARLERQVDSNEDLLPSGDDLAAELEAFLRDTHNDADTDPDNNPGDTP